MTIHQPTSPALTAFGKAIKAAREGRKWSLAKLADEALGNPDRKGYCSQVEKGLRNLSEGTIRNFARALDLPDTVIPVTGHVLPFEDDTTASDATATALLHEVETLTDKLKLSEALAVAIAYKYADGNPTDIEGALKGVEAALELAAKDQARGALKSNYDDAAEEIIRKVNALNAEGDIDEAYETLKRDAARRAEAREAQKAEDERIIDLLITQASLANDADGYAQAHLQMVQLDSPNAEDTFKRLRDLWKERFQEGHRLGTPFALTAAAGLARQCAQIAPTPYLRAMAQNDLAAALQDQGSRTEGAAGNALLTDAVESYRAALRVRAEADHPVKWAMTMQNLAGAQLTQGSRTEGAAGNALLTEAGETYRAALRVRTEADHPVDWAETMQNLANALATQGSRNDGAAGNALLAEAEESYRAALRVYTEADHPVHWAATMQNLAAALQNQGSRTEDAAGNALLAEAVDSFRAALRVRTEAHHPVDWAITMQNLAAALQTQGRRTEGAAGNALLAEAVESYRAALRVRSEDDHPVQWAMTQENLAHTELARAGHGSTGDPQPHLSTALAHVDNALRIFDPVHLSYNHAKATRLREHLRKVIAEQDGSAPS